MDKEPRSRWRRRAPWLLLAGLLALRIGLSLTRCPYGKTDPDVGFWSRGAKHWAIYGSWGLDDISTEFVVPLHAWILGGVFRLFGPSYGSAVGWSQTASALATAIVAWGLRRESPAVLTLSFLLFWADGAVAWCASSGGVEPTQSIGLAASMLLAGAGRGSSFRWTASGFFYAWALAAKPTALILAPAYALLAFQENGVRDGARRLLAFVAGALPIAATAALFAASHPHATVRAWEQMRFQAGDHHRSLFDAAGIALFHWGNFGWRNTLIPLFLFALPACAPIFSGGSDRSPPEKPLQKWGWFFLSGLIGLTLFPPGARRYVLVALPLAVLAARVLTESRRWEEAVSWLDRPRGKAVLAAWALLALFPLFSYVKEPMASWLHGRTGYETARCQGLAGWILLAAAGPALAAAWRMAGFLAGTRETAQRWLLAGGGSLLANFLLVRFHGVSGKFLGNLAHMDPAWRAAPREAVERASLVTAASWLVSLLLLCGIWRLRVTRADGAVRAERARRHLAGLAWLLAAAGLLWPVLRLARTDSPPSTLPEVSRRLAALVPPDATVYGGRYADVILLPARCRVVTPWAWHGHDVDSFLASTARYQWNLPIERFHPDFLLLEDEAEDPDVGRVWAPWLAGVERRLIAEFLLDRHTLRLYALGGASN